MATKVAIPTDDGKTISQHFGQAAYFQVLTLENGQVTNSEQREKAHHEHGSQHEHDHQNGTHPGQAMFEGILDCQVLIAGGMGQPAYQRAQNQGMQVFLTGEKSISNAVTAYQAGELNSDQRSIHMH